MKLSMMMFHPKISLPVIAATAALSACMPAPAPVSAPAPIAVSPLTPTPVSGIAGLQERQPDLCGAKDYVSALSQPGSIIPTLGITKQYRVVEFRGIEPQNYVPNRLVFRLDQAGTITNVDCG